MCSAKNVETSEERVVRKIKEQIDLLAQEESRRYKEGRKKPNESLRNRLEIGSLVEEYGYAYMGTGAEGAVKNLSDKVGRSEPDLWHHRQFKRLHDNNPEKVEGWIEEGMSWSEVIKKLPEEDTGYHDKYSGREVDI